MISLISIALAAATAPTPLKPSGKWTVDYGKDMCVVSRPFGPADAGTIFALRPPISMLEGGQTLYLLTPAKGGDVRRGQAAVTLHPSSEQKKIDYVSWLSKDNKFRVYEIYAGEEFSTLLGETTTVEIKAGKEAFAFATGRIQPVLDALATCNRDLFKSWGIDPIAKAKPLGGVSPAAWFPENGYPYDAKERGVQGRSVIIVTVSGDGKPTACRAVIKSDPVLDDATCKMAIHNGRFEKSPGKEDRFAVFAIRWQLFG